MFDEPGFGHFEFPNFVIHSKVDDSQGLPVFDGVEVDLHPPMLAVINGYKSSNPAMKPKLEPVSYDWTHYELRELFHRPTDACYPGLTPFLGLKRLSHSSLAYCLLAAPYDRDT